MPLRKRSKSSRERRWEFILARRRLHLFFAQPLREPLDGDAKRVLTSAPTPEDIPRDPIQPEPRILPTRDRVELAPCDQIRLGEDVRSVLRASHATQRIGEQVASRFPEERLEPALTVSLLLASHERSLARNCL